MRRKADWFGSGHSTKMLATPLERPPLRFEWSKFLANRRLRERLAARADAEGVELYLPTPAYCTDNGAMIAVAAVRHLDEGGAALDIDVDPGLSLA